MKGCAAIGLPAWVCPTGVNACLAAALGLLVDGIAAAGVAAVLASMVPLASRAWRAVATAAVFVVELFYLVLLEFTLMLVALGRGVSRRLRRGPLGRRSFHPRRRPR